VSSVTLWVSLSLHVFRSALKLIHLGLWLYLFVWQGGKRDLLCRINLLDIDAIFFKWTFLLRSRWTNVKGLYIVTRYVPFLILIGNLYSAHSCSAYYSSRELTFSQVNFSNENPDVCRRAVIYWLTNGAYCILLLEMPNAQYHLRRYVRSTFTHALAKIAFARTAISIASAICSECDAPSPNIVHSWSRFLQVFLFSEHMRSGTITD